MKPKMKLKLSLCPRCELNYITESETFCKICLQDMQSSGTQEEVELCTVCNENPVMSGKDVCAICFQEMSGGDEANEENPDDERSVGHVDLGVMDSVAEMDEILPEGEHIDGEAGDIENPVSLEAEQEMEDAFDDEDEEDQ